MNFDFDEMNIYEELDKITRDYDEFYDMDLRKWSTWYGDSKSNFEDEFKN